MLDVVRKFLSTNAKFGPKTILRRLKDKIETHNLLCQKFAALFVLVLGFKIWFRDNFWIL